MLICDCWVINWFAFNSIIPFVQVKTQQQTIPHFLSHLPIDCNNHITHIHCIFGLLPPKQPKSMNESKQLGNGKKTQTKCIAANNILVSIIGKSRICVAASLIGWPIHGMAPIQWLVMNGFRHTAKEANDDGLFLFHSMNYTLFWLIGWLQWSARRKHNPPNQIPPLLQLSELLIWTNKKWNCSQLVPFIAANQHSIHKWFASFIYGFCLPFMVSAALPVQLFNEHATAALVSILSTKLTFIQLFRK